jgi:hypothetical protein
MPADALARVAPMPATMDLLSTDRRLSAALDHVGRGTNVVCYVCMIAAVTTVFIADSAAGATATATAITTHTAGPTPTAIATHTAAVCFWPCSFLPSVLVHSIQSYTTPFSRVTSHT